MNITYMHAVITITCAFFQKTLFAVICTTCFSDLQRTKKYTEYVNITCMHTVITITCAFFSEILVRGYLHNFFERSSTYKDIQSILNTSFMHAVITITCDDFFLKSLFVGICTTLLNHLQRTKKHRVYKYLLMHTVTVSIYLIFSTSIIWHRFFSRSRRPFYCCYRLLKRKMTVCN